MGCETIFNVLIPISLLSLLARRYTAGSLNDLGDIVAQLRHGCCHVLGECVTEGFEGVALAAHELVTAANELNELTGVDVWISAVLDVLEEFGWY